MGKWAKYSIYDKGGRLIVTFKGQKVKQVKPAKSHEIGFRPISDAVSELFLDVQVDCDCGEGHEEHIE